MTSVVQLRIGQARRTTLGVSVIALLVAAALTALHPGDFVFAYRFAVFACLAPAVGSTLFFLIHRSTGGQWGDALQPFLRAGVRLVPWLWLLVLPLLWLAPTQLEVRDSPLLRLYLSQTGLILRAVIYAAVFFFFAWAAAPLDSAEGGMRGHRWRGLGPVGLIVMTFTLHLVATDWLLALEPNWYSTAFPLVWMTGQAVTGLSIAVLAGVIFGAEPATKGQAGRALGLDWGNLLLTGVVFWSYLAFMEFLIIWNGNLPNEVIWYVHRSQGLWLGVILALLAYHFVLPFLILLSRKLKQRSTGLSVVAASLVIAQIIYLAWMILPASPGATAPAYALCLALLLGGGALMFNFYLRLAHTIVAGTAHS